MWFTTPIILWVWRLNRQVLPPDFVFNFFGGIHDFEVSLSPSLQLNPILLPRHVIYVRHRVDVCVAARGRVSESENGASPSLYFVFPKVGLVSGSLCEYVKVSVLSNDCLI